MNVSKWKNTVAFLVMIAVNTLANLLSLGGNTTGEVSAAYPNLFTPAPITFAVWGIIYLLMGAFVFYQWGILDNNQNSQNAREAIGNWFLISCVFNIAWIFAWHFGAIGISVLMMFGLLFSLGMILKRLRFPIQDRTFRIFAKTGFEIYLGWIAAALIANISVYLTKTNWNGLGLSDVFWTIAALLIGTAAGTVFSLRKNHHFAATLTIIWAYIGILIKHFSASGYNGQYYAVIITALIGITVMSSSIFLHSPRYPVTVFMKRRTLYENHGKR